MRKSLTASGRGIPRRSVLGGIGAVGMGVAGARAQTGPETRGVRAVPPSRSSPGQAPILMPGTDMHVGPIRAVAISSDGTLVATGSADRSIRLWRAATGEGLLRLNLPLGEGSIGVVDALAFSPDFHRLYVSGLDWAGAAGSSRGMVYVFDLTTGQLTGLMAWADDFGSRLRTLSVSPNGAQIAMAAGNNGLIVRDTAPNGFQLRYSDPASATVAISAVSYSPDGRLLATASSAGQLRLLEVGADGEVKELSRRALPGGGQANSLAFSSDGQQIAIGYGDRPLVHIVPVKPGAAPVALAPPAGASNGNLAAIAWGRDEDGQGWLFAGGTVVNTAGRNLLLGWRDGRPGSPAVLPVSSDSITQIAAHPKAGLVFGSSDPRWGSALPDRGSRSLRLVRAQDTERLDFRGVAARVWGVNAAGTTVVFRGASADATTLRFDLTELTLARSASRTAGLSRPSPVPDRTQPPKFLALPRGAFLRSTDTALELDRTLFGTDDYLILADAAGRELNRCEIATTAWGVAIAKTGKVGVAAHGDGTIRWYSLRPDQPLTELGGLFVTADEQRWIAWRADGRFAHSPGGGAKLVGFLQNGQFEPGKVSQGGLTGRWLDIDQLYRRLYDPDQVQAMLGADAPPAPGKPEIDRLSLPVIHVRSLCAADDWSPATRGIRASKALAGAALPDDATALPANANACRSIDATAVAPDEAISLPAGTTAMRVMLSLDAAGPSAQVAVFVNEQNVGHAVIHQDASRAVGPTPVEQHVPLFPGENRVEFRAYAADNQTFTRAPTVLRVNIAAATQAADRAKLHVLVVGIDEYGGTIPKLRYAKADADTFAKAIQRRAARVYADASVVTLYNGDATVDAVTAKLAAMAAEARPDDAVVIYFSGHGVVGTDDKSYAFVTADVTDANAVLRGGLGMGADRLARGLVEMRAERIFVFLDTCFAGGFDPRTIGYLNQDTGRYVLAASTRLAEAQDSYDGINGLFAYAIKESLDGGAATSSGSIDAFDVGRYVTARVAELAQQKSWEQRAVFQAAGQITAFPLFSSSA